MVRLGPILCSRTHGISLAALTGWACRRRTSTGTLKLNDSANFSGTVAGLNGQDTIDFIGIDPTKVQQASYPGTILGGTLIMSDETHTAQIALLLGCRLLSLGTDKQRREFIHLQYVGTPRHDAGTHLVPLPFLREGRFRQTVSQFWNSASGRVVSRARLQHRVEGHPFDPLG